MTLPDAINGLFECLGGVLLFKNCHRLYLDKEVKGVSVPVTGFFMAWGIWNTYYYPSLDQWLSFTGGLVIVSANFLWVAMAVYYTHFTEAPTVKHPNGRVASCQTKPTKD